MALDPELISQFAKLVNKDKKTKVEATVYGTIVEDGNGNKYVKLDGSDQLTPLSDDERPNLDSTTVDANVGERVSVLIKDHTATVTGNVSSPAARTADVVDVKQAQILLAQQVQADQAYFKKLLADEVTLGKLEAANASITDLIASTADIEKLLADKITVTDLIASKIDADVVTATYATIENLTATDAKIGTLSADYATFKGVSTEKFTAYDANINKILADMIVVSDMVAKKIDADVVVATYATIKSLNATDAKFETLSADYASFKDVSTSKFTAYDADIERLNTNSLTAEQANITYAKIDFSNIIGAKIDEAAIEHLFASSGMVKDITIDNGTITGELVGVTLKGDLVEAGTLKADRLVVKGENGIYYKLNIEGGAIAGAEVTDEQLQNGLSGSIILAKSITAEKVKVSDLVAFGATIGGFQITDDSIHSVVKQTVNDTTRGFYVDNDGQLNVGDETNFVKFFKDTDGTYKLKISADSIVLGSSKKNVEDIVAEVEESVKTNSEDLTNYIAATNKELENLQGQIDGSIMTWFYEYVPTNSNIPASEWTTTDLKNNHLGDLFYDLITGYCYRWQVQNNQYSWNRITDVDVTKALADAAAAQATADNKRRVFVTTPTPPYEVGDLWAQGGSGDLMRCQTAKTASQSYAAADWVKASKYTDDTAANAAQADANALKTRVTNAETRISQNETAIELRATKTEVENKFVGYYTKTESDANLKVSSDSIKTEVSNTYATKQEVSDLEIGGTNLLINSSFTEDLEGWTPDSDSTTNGQGTVSGTGVIAVDDVCPDQNTHGAEGGVTAKVHRKNILPYPYKETTKTISGVKFTDNGDGTITANGTATAQIIYWLVQEIDLLKANETYALSGSVGGSDTTYLLNVSCGGQYPQSKNGAVSFVAKSNIVSAYIVVCSGVTLNNVVFKPMLNKGETATEYEPYINHIDVYGKNLLPYPYKETTKTIDGITFTDNRDGTITANGTATAQIIYWLAQDKDSLKVDETYTISGSFGGSYDTWLIQVSCGGQYKHSQNGGTSFVAKSNIFHVSIVIRSGVTLNNVVFKPMISTGSTATEYEPYTKTTYYVDETGNAIITNPISPCMTVMVKPPTTSLELTYKNSGFLTKLGKPCFCIKSTDFGSLKYAMQDILPKIEPDSMYTFSGWVLTENVVWGDTNPLFQVYISGYYTNDAGGRVWYGLRGMEFPRDTAGRWQRVTYTIPTSGLRETALYCNLYMYMRDTTGALYFRDLKLERGNKATDWSPAPEDVETEIADTRFEISEVAASITTTAESITAQALNSYVKVDDYEQYRKDAESKFILSSSGLEGQVSEIEQTITSGEFEQVKIVGKNYAMTKDGFTVGSADENNKFTTNITETGMKVKNNGNEVLVANNDGVKAEDLHASTYLIIGDNCRFETYNGNRTACFWIGS